jgi:putative acetyltransferase
MSVPFLFRNAGTEDIPAILACFETAILAINNDVYSPEQKKAWIRKGRENKEKWIERVKNQYFRLAEAENKGLIGFASINKAGYVEMLFTHPSFQRKGLATMLYHQLETFALNNRVILLETHASAVSKPFFTSKGFKLIAEKKFDFFGVPISNFHLSKQLD